MLKIIVELTISYISLFVIIVWH